LRDARRQQRHSVNDLRRDAFLTPQLALSQNAGSTTGATKKSLRAYRGAAADSSPLAACSRIKQAK
jgi:hypothetical protein